MIQITQEEYDKLLKCRDKLKQLKDQREFLLQKAKITFSFEPDFTPDFKEQCNYIQAEIKELEELLK